MSQKISGQIIFGNIIIPSSQIFLLRKNVFGLINHKPYVPGHVLVCSRRIVPKFQDLTEIQALDLFITAQQICKKLQPIYNHQYGIILQNGKDAGQTVPHVHLHLLPTHNQGVDNEDIEVRTEQDMSKEAEKYRSCFEQSSQ